MSLDTRAAPRTVDDLKPLLPASWALGRRHLIYVALWTLFGMYLSYIPVFHSDIWGHVHYGQWILEHRALPVEDPFTPLAEGVPVIDTAWLGQVLFALVQQAAGTEGISCLFAATVLGTFLIHLRTMTLRSGRADAACFACLMIFVALFSRHAIARPEIFGGFCFALLALLVTRVDSGVSSARKGDGDWISHPDPRVPWSLYLGVPLLFVCWANLHGSFIVGVVFLGCKLLGRAVEVAWAARSPLAVIQDRWVRRWLLLVELALAATLVNPYGVDLLLNVFQFSHNPNLPEVVEWYPMDGKSWEGIHFAITLVALIVLWRHSPKPVLPADVILLAVFAVATFPTVRMIGWYSLIAGYVAAPHLGELLPRWFAPAFAPLPEDQRSFRYSLLACLIAWMGFTLSPLSTPVLGGQPRKDASLYSKDTPRGVTEYLRQHPPQGQVFNPQWWGDWLAWDGPKGIQLFMTTNAVHVAPPAVWRDYLHIARGQSGWERVMQRYNVRTMIIHKKLQVGLASSSRRLAGWHVAYEDEVGMVLKKGPRPEIQETKDPKDKSAAASIKSPPAAAHEDVAPTVEELPESDLPESPRPETM